MPSATLSAQKIILPGSGGICIQVPPTPKLLTFHGVHSEFQISQRPLSSAIFPNPSEQLETSFPLAINI